MRVLPLASLLFGFAVSFSLGAPNYPQTRQEPAPPKQPASTTSPAGDNRVDAIRILYTGKTFGYFRIPDWQSPAADGSGCKDPARQKDRSVAAAEFDQLLKDDFQIDKTKGAVLVGTGDNFAPEIEARDFCDPPPGQAKPETSYQRIGKELFDWDANSQRWIRSDGHTKENEAPANGIFMIPTDNVANFFITEGYAALVPGKQDFYFGPERIRELARFMATQPIPSTAKTLHKDGEGPQMLGANLVIETTWNGNHKPLPDSDNPPWFIPRFPEASDFVGSTSPSNAEIRMTGLPEGAKVYPWFRGVSFELSGTKAQSELLPAINSTIFYLCPVNAKTPGDPNAIPKSIKDSPCKALEKKSGGKPTQFILDFPWIDAQHFYTLRPGANYGLCAVATAAKMKAADGTFTFCERFSVYTPFFQSSGDSDTRTCSDLQKPECYHDPDPYVLIEAEDESGIKEDVAIFGVVDPTMGANVGLLNFAWSNQASKNFKTETTVEEPAEAVKEMLDAFSRRFDEEGYTEEIAAGKRRLIKVLLAQMNSEEAEILGTRLKEFQVVVSAADPELATVGDTITSSWNAPKAGSVRHPMILAIPEPYIVGSRNPSAVADIGRFDIRISADADPKWTLYSEHMEPGLPSDKAPPANTAAAFWSAVKTTLERDCREPEFGSESQTAQIETLTLCEMQKATHADVALLQERDFFAALPADAGDIPDLNTRQPEEVLQQLLDRIVWKGDFLTLIYLPGSALETAMKQSKTFETADKSNLNVAEYKNRELLSVGITYDAVDKEYFIDGDRLDPTKLYSVATSDFIGGGDTGYPALAAAQIKSSSLSTESDKQSSSTSAGATGSAQQPSSSSAEPSDFDKQLVTISGTVCRGLAGENWVAHCIGPIDRDTYLDVMARGVVGAEPADMGPSNTPAEQLWEWSLFHRTRAVPGHSSAAEARAETLQNTMDQIIEYRPLWDFDLAKATFGVTTLGHSGTDAEVDENFGGIATSGVNSHRFTDWASDFEAQLTRNWRRYQVFARPAYTFNAQYKGESNASRQINQVANLGMFDLGAARLWAERGPEHLDAVFTAHFETPLEETVTTFALKSTVPSSLTFSQPRGYTTLLRAGMRWQRRVSSIEFGPEAGYQRDALEGFNFLANGEVTATCLALSGVSFATCVANYSNPKVTNPPTITASSQVTTLLGSRNHAGGYWRTSMTVPFHPRVNYVFTDSGDWFFVHFATENTTDTRFLDLEEHQLKLNIFPSLSIGPELDLLFYENKTVGPLQGTFLRQDQILMKAEFDFDLFNMRKKVNQIEYAPEKAQ